MEVIVLVKQVPDTEALIQIADDGKSVNISDIRWTMNPYDELAVEEALRIKETHGGRVTVLCMGPPHAEEAIRTALAMGADSGVHICDPALEGSDVLATAKILAAAIKEMPFDLIIAGMRAVDEDNYQIGGAVAEYLDIPQISMVIKTEISDGRIRCQRVMEGGSVMTDTALPALITAQRGLNEPRFISLPGIRKAKNKSIVLKTLADLGLDSATAGSANRKVKISAMRLLPQNRTLQMIEGESARLKAAILIKMLHEETKVI